MSKLSIALIGAGAVGCYYAGHFSRAGASVTILTRTPDAYDGPIRIDSKQTPLNLFLITFVHFKIPVNHLML